MILDKIAKKTRERVEGLKKVKPFDDVRRLALSLSDNTSMNCIVNVDGNSRDIVSNIDNNSRNNINTHTFPFEKVISATGLSFICEVKKGSPSKGIIDKDFNYINIAKEYEAAGAAAISVLTEPDFFFGSDQHLIDISKSVTTPLLRKDFTIDPYQIYEAKVIGASAVLLICALLDTETLRGYIKIADSLGLSALVETHDESEVESALDAGARIIGVNNRNLKTFEVDINTSVRLRKLVPDNILFVAESGIKTREDILKLDGADAALIGETLMRSRDKKKELDILRGKV